MQPAQKDGREMVDVGAKLRNLIDAISDEKPVARNPEPTI